MRFLVDVNASGFLSRWIRDLGHDVAEVRQIDPEMTDSDILQWALTERRIIVTTDIDFEEMIWRERRTHCGLIRLENVPRKQRLALFKDTLERHRLDLEQGSIVIALRRSFRVRRSW
jgi:predicted nuclease of predicted toxin-antitoxin system